MTKKFKETVDCLAKAWNAEDGNYLLITQCGDDENIRVETQGGYAVILSGIVEVIRYIFSTVSDEEARIIRKELKNLIVEDEKKRCQEGAEE